MHLTLKWAGVWGDTRPVADELKYRFPDRWVRFHSLSKSKRYADNDAEYQILLDRHHDVLDWLAKECRGGEFAVITAYATGQSVPPDSPKEFADVGLDQQYWMTAQDEEDFDIWAHLYVGRTALTPETLDPLLRGVADEELCGVVIAPFTLEWLYHPYDGGADVILETTERRNELRDRFCSWLSTDPSGL
jgi:hypothetical protein